MVLLTTGAVAVSLAAFLGGATGFGYGLVSTPLLLLMGLPLPFVITVNLLLGLSTRVVTAIGMRRDLDTARVAALMAGNVPGLLVGALVLTWADPSAIRRAVGCVVIVAGILMAALRVGHRRRHGTGVSLAVGFVGGVLGSSSSLNGIPPALMYMHEQSEARRFVADLAGYFVLSNTLALAVLAIRGTFTADALFPAVVVWLPAVLLANHFGTALSTRLPGTLFRRIVLGLVVLGGASTIVTA
ncbi:sulfite exporter TauE/SafE family protein [Streptomyces hirsutus]|uniref:sulfite exporter TauE/SafE family protein n=1 Tax=Streptomyces hirsutus TaxID=35620 RepID=UPI0036544D63